MHLHHDIFSQPAKNLVMTHESSQALQKTKFGAKNFLMISLDVSMIQYVGKFEFQYYNIFIFIFLYVSKFQ